MNQNQAPLIRVSRKRTADPHEALIVHIKKHKSADPVVFTLFKTEDNNDEMEGVHVVDYSKKVVAEQPVGIDDSGEGSSSASGSGSGSAPPIHQVLDFVNDDAIGEIGDHRENQKEVVHEQVMLNGQVMVPVQSPAAESVSESNQVVGDDMVFDYYRLNAANDQNAALYSNQFLRINALSEESFDVRFANRHEALLLANNSDSDDSDIHPDDDDDSNDEDNWRNDYPDEDSYDENSDDGEGSYGNLVAEEFHRDLSGFPDESMQRRFQNFSLNDQHESYFEEGEETSDDDE